VPKGKLRRIKSSKIDSWRTCTEQVELQDWAGSEPARLLMVRYGTIHVPFCTELLDVPPLSVALV
jgi:hypothetical protein